MGEIKMEYQKKTKKKIQLTQKKAEKEEQNNRKQRRQKQQNFIPKSIHIHNYTQPKWTKHSN